MGGGDEGSEMDVNCLFVHNWLRSSPSGSALSPGTQQNEISCVRLSMREKGEGRKKDRHKDGQRECVCV